MAHIIRGDRRQGTDRRCTPWNDMAMQHDVTTLPNGAAKEELPSDTLHNKPESKAAVVAQEDANDEVDEMEKLAKAIEV